MNLGPHAATIWACYAIVGIVLAGLAAWLVFDGRRLAAEIEALERRGIKRRSARDEAPAQPEPNTRTS